MRSFTLCVCITSILLLPACNSEPKTMKVTGKLLLKEQPYLAKHNGSLEMMFIPVVEEGQHFDSFAAEVNREDGTFVVKGKAGKGIPAGKYRITVHQMVMDAPAVINELNERFSQKDSKVIRDITDETPIVIDLAKPTGQ